MTTERKAQIFDQAVFYLIQISDSTELFNTLLDFGMTESEIYEELNFLVEGENAK